MKIQLIGEYEVTYQGGEPALVIHHLVRGHDVASFGQAEAGALRELLGVRQRRIRELGGQQLILGAAGDLTIYGPGGARACYLNEDQAATLGKMLADDA